MMILGFFGVGFMAYRRQNKMGCSDRLISSAELSFEAAAGRPFFC